jgi:hypothetical protein
VRIEELRAHYEAVCAIRQCLKRERFSVGSSHS